jgi:hypothetical protein
MIKFRWWYIYIFFLGYLLADTHVLAPIHEWGHFRYANEYEYNMFEDIHQVIIKDIDPDKYEDMLYGGYRAEWSACMILCVSGILYPPLAAIGGGYLTALRGEGLRSHDFHMAREKGYNFDDRWNATLITSLVLWYSVTAVAIALRAYGLLFGKQRDRPVGPHAQ